jgi:hypothetical protein
MRIAVVLVLMLVLAAPTHAQLDPDEDGCMDWGDGPFDIGIADEWTHRIGNPDYIGDTVGVATQSQGQAENDDEVMWMEMDFGREYVVTSMDLFLELASPTLDSDMVEVRLPKFLVTERWQPLEAYVTPDSAAQHLVWQGNQVTSSLGLFIRANVDEADPLERVYLYNVTICVDESVDLTNLALVMHGVFASPLTVITGVMVAFLLLMGLAKVLYTNFMPRTD